MDLQPMNWVPTSIKKQGRKSLLITWEDGHVSRYSFRLLRQHCPCAACVDEWTGKTTLNPENVALDLEGLKVEPVGNYALSFSFSDHHDTGLFHFELLRSICPCESCQTNRPMVRSGN